MAFLSVGVLLSSKQFLLLVASEKVGTKNFKAQFSRFEFTTPDEILSASQTCQWIQLDASGFLSLTDTGKAIALANDLQALRLQLKDFIYWTKPAWAQLLSRGRGEAVKLLPDNVIECLENADLLHSESDDCIAWWDALAKAARDLREDANVALGRKGERMSWEFERRRTGVPPVRQWLISEFSGYDLRSQLSRRDTDPLNIEVKASAATRTTGGFYLSSNEAHVAATAPHHQFHLWAMRPLPQLFILPALEVLGHVPENRKSGEWQTVWIPYGPLLAGRTPAWMKRMVARRPGTVHKHHA